MDEVAKHNDDKDPWVVVGDQVLAVKDFLPDHPGGAKAIMLYAGRDVGVFYYYVYRNHRTNRFSNRFPVFCTVFTDRLPRSEPTPFT